MMLEDPGLLCFSALFIFLSRSCLQSCFETQTLGSVLAELAPAPQPWGLSRVGWGGCSSGHHRTKPDGLFQKPWVPGCSGSGAVPRVVACQQWEPSGWTGLSDC